ncbi:MAG: hypothetical protein P4L90_25880 [Rhodopila sp.]|nr:hypothetical protein [Rhodopila sp.]
MPDASNRLSFSAWIDVLREDVIEDEFGYERGEFTVYPSEWQPLFDEGLTPRQAWQRALDAFAAERAERDRQQAESWERIQASDRAITASPPLAGADDGR